MKRTITILAIIILTLSSISIATANNVESQNRTIYVDDDNTDGPWLGSLEYPFNNIQDGINESNDGDTVFVFSGYYKHKITDNIASISIFKRINLLGEDKFNTILDGTDFNSVVEIKFIDGVTLSGFTIQNPLVYGIRIRVQENSTRNTIIKDNIIINCYGGITVNQRSTNLVIKNNIITNNHDGIRTDVLTSNITISNNVISDNENGIRSDDGDVFVSNNMITNNSIGIHLMGLKDYIIELNNISNNEIGIESYNSWINVIKNNFIDNDKHFRNFKFINLFLIPSIIFYREKWFNNYWDHWFPLIPKLITGINIISITIFLPIKPYDWEIPIGILPSFKLDIFPAMKPIEINI